MAIHQLYTVIVVASFKTINWTVNEKETIPLKTMIKLSTLKWVYTVIKAKIKEMFL